MAKKNLRRLTLEEKKAALANLVKYKEENGTTMAEAEKALGFSKNQYLSLRRALKSAQSDVVFYKSEKKERKPRVLSTKSNQPAQQMALIMGTPDQIREFLNNGNK